MFEQSVEICISAKSLPETLRLICGQLNGCANYLTCAPTFCESCSKQCKTEIKPIYDWVHDLYTWKKRQQQKHSAASITDRSRRPSILTPFTVQTRNKIAKLSTAPEVKIKEEKENEFVAEIFDEEIGGKSGISWKIPKVEENSMAAKQQLAWDVKVPEINTDPLYWTCAEVVEYLKKTDASFFGRRYGA